MNDCPYCTQDNHRCPEIVKSLYRLYPEITCKEVKDIMMNNWSCLPSAFGICMGVTLEKMIELIGHDGSAEIWPRDPSPLNRRGFHIQEILHACYKLNYFAMPVALNPTLSNDRGPAIQIHDTFFEDAKTKLGVHLGISDAGINHAVAHIPVAGFWCPSRREYIASFDTREVWLVHKCTGST